MYFQVFTFSSLIPFLQCASWYTTFKPSSSVLELCSNNSQCIALTQSQASLSEKDFHFCKFWLSIHQLIIWLFLTRAVFPYFKMRDKISLLCLWYFVTSLPAIRRPKVPSINLSENCFDSRLKKLKTMFFLQVVCASKKIQGIWKIHFMSGVRITNVT